MRTVGTLCLLEDYVPENRKCSRLIIMNHDDESLDQKENEGIFGKEIIYYCKCTTGKKNVFLEFINIKKRAFGSFF